MLTDRQRAKCRSIAEALDRGDQGPWLAAEPSCTPEMRGEIWDQRAHVKEMAARAAQRRQTAGARVISTVQQTSGARMNDLDYWADDVSPEPDDDDDDPMPVCGACGGTGKTRSGGTCQICHGKGRIPAEDQPDDDDEMGKKSYGYEFEEE